MLRSGLRNVRPLTLKWERGVPDYHKANEDKEGLEITDS